MKKVYLVHVFLIFLVTNTFAQKTGSAITWDKSTHDFGEIVQGEKVYHIFKFTNTGTEPLVITNVEVTCGCTTPKGWPRDPVNPGGKGEIEIKFDSTHKMGRLTKVVVIVSNAAEGNSQITFTANVLEKKIPN